jgi:hypothetical protein
LVAPGQLILALLDARPCELTLLPTTASMLTGFSVNWYQRNYPYVWAGARMVRDL